MSNVKTRYFLLGSAAVLTAGLAAGTAAYLGGMPRAFASNAGPDELTLVPAGAAVVAYANVQGVMSSEFRQRLTSLMDEDAGKGRQEFQEHTGIDVERDIDAVIAAMAAPVEGANIHDGGFVALRGRFDTGVLFTNSFGSAWVARWIAWAAIRSHDRATCSQVGWAAYIRRAAAHLSA